MATFSLKKKSFNMRSCCVPMCDSTAGKNRNCSFHKFPNASEFVVVDHERVGRKNEWIRAFRITTAVSRKMTVCSKHFLRSDYLFPDRHTPNKHLKKTAVPTQNLPKIAYEPKWSTVNTKRKEQYNNKLKEKTLSPAEAMMGDSLDASRVTVKVEPQETGDTVHSFYSDATYISVEHNYSSKTSVEPCSVFLIEPKPPVDNESDKSKYQINSEDNAAVYCGEFSSVFIKSEPLSELNFYNEDTLNPLSYYIEPKVEISDINSLPGSRINFDTNEEEFINALNYVNCKLEPSSPHHNPNSNDDPLSCSNEPKQQVDQVVELLRRKYMIQDCFVKVERLDFLKKINSTTRFKIKQVFRSDTDRWESCFESSDTLKAGNIIGSDGSVTKHTRLTCKQQYACSACYHRFRTQFQLQKHLALHSHYKCVSCDRYFFTHRELKSHSVVIHGVQKYSCDKCGQTFHCAIYLAIHKRLHGDLKSRPRKQDGFCQNERLFPCVQCVSTHVTKEELASHVSLTHSTKFVCSICKVSFPHIEYLSSHLREHLSTVLRITNRLPQLDGGPT